MSLKPEDLTGHEIAEKPLHVRVAEALGLHVKDTSYTCSGQCVRAIEEGADFPTPHDSHEPHRHGGWSYWKPYEYEEGGDWESCPRYDTDWSATGPLIEKYRIQVGPSYCYGLPSGPFAASVGNGEHRDGTTWEYGETPLTAVCNLLLTLAAAGELR